MRMPARASRVHRGFLAEDYDGVGQYVLVSLSKASTAVAKLARVASGDFGGGRTFPSGTPVTVFSNHGRLEVGLGNRPRRCWRLPIEILWKGKIDHTPGLEDFSCNFEFDLVSHWEETGNAGLFSYAGVLLQNYTGAAPIMGIDTYGGGEVSGSGNHWQGETSSFVENVLPAPSGKTFFVRHEITEQRSKAKAWFEGNAEPDWQIEKFDITGSRIFLETQDLHLYVYAQASKFQVDFSVDHVTIVRGYGPTPFRVDSFNREVSADRDAHWGRASSGIGSWNNEYLGEALRSPIAVSDSHGRILGYSVTEWTLGNQTLLIPQCSR